MPIYIMIKGKGRPYYRHSGIAVEADTFSEVCEILGGKEESTLEMSFSLSSIKQNKLWEEITPGHPVPNGCRVFRLKRFNDDRAEIIIPATGTVSPDTVTPCYEEDPTVKYTFSTLLLIPKAVV
ncbi:MAG: hypothetical protein ABH876_00375 [Patescibacteria group bacterium]|nr:hypothetical protein [Patescibacteria group bacterium]MBU1877031.1 hypothetical protein [Patescibacteria group bacterium]